MPDLKELDDKSFLFETRKIEKLLGVSSPSRRNCPFTRAVTRPVSISRFNKILFRLADILLLIERFTLKRNLD